MTGRPRQEALLGEIRGGELSRQRTHRTTALGSSITSPSVVRAPQPPRRSVGRFRPVQQDDGDQAA